MQSAQKLFDVLKKKSAKRSEYMLQKSAYSLFQLWAFHRSAIAHSTHLRRALLRQIRWSEDVLTSDDGRWSSQLRRLQRVLKVPKKLLTSAEQT